jgi:hypothetical protein
MQREDNQVQAGEARYVAGYRYRGGKISNRQERKDTFLDRTARKIIHTSGDKPGVSKGAIRRYSTTSTYRAVNGVPKLGNP